jgi:hypothetical protein
VTVGDLVDYCLSSQAPRTYPCGEQDLARGGGKAHSPTLRESPGVEDLPRWEYSLAAASSSHGYPKAGSTRVVPAHCGATRNDQLRVPGAGRFDIGRAVRVTLAEETSGG